MAENLKIVMIDDNTDFLFTMETFLKEMVLRCTRLKTVKRELI